MLLVRVLTYPPNTLKGRIMQGYKTARSRNESMNAGEKNHKAPVKFESNTTAQKKTANGTQNKKISGFNSGIIEGKI